MSWDKWFKTFQDTNGVCAYETDDLRAAYEAGQRDMRERCLEVLDHEIHIADANDASPDAAAYIDVARNIIRAIKLESE